MPIKSPIHKQRRNATISTHPLVGRRVAVPQRFTEVEDDGDGFCFDAIIVSADERRAVLKFCWMTQKETQSIAKPILVFTSNNILLIATTSNLCKSYQSDH